MDDNEAETKPMTRRPRILVINPNSNEAVTEGLRQAVQPLNYAEGPEIACTTLGEGPYAIETQEHADSVTIPLRIFDRNQGEKLRTQLDIDRNEKLMEATRAQVFSDVDSAYATVNSTVILLKPYKDRYLQQASRVRDTIAFSYEHGAASLLDFLNAQADYRSVQVNYLNLVASYLSAASQLNLAVGREVIQ